MFMNNEEITIAFRNILKRMKSEANKERYNALVLRPTSESEERIWDLCKKFWPSAYENRDGDLNTYVVNDNIDPIRAKRYLAELESMLDNLGWSK